MRYRVRLRGGGAARVEAGSQGDVTLRIPLKNKEALPSPPIHRNDYGASNTTGAQWVFCPSLQASFSCH